MTDFPAILRRLGEALDGTDLPLGVVWPTVHIGVEAAPEDYQRSMLRLIASAFDVAPTMAPSASNKAAWCVLWVFDNRTWPSIRVTVSRSLVTDGPEPDPVVRVRTFAGVIG